MKTLRLLMNFWTEASTRTREVKLVPPEFFPAGIFPEAILIRIVLTVQTIPTGCMVAAEHPEILHLK